MLKTIVKTVTGNIRGQILRDIEGNQYLSFRGVPYAKPPVGKLRFKLPEPAEAWTETRDSLDESPISAQYETVTGTPEGDDDCLYLDVATRNIEPDQARPVMVWIHGGAFKSSSNTYKKYGPDYLLRHDIVFVAINYRLGILGFLNMEHEECPGNQGLHDQILALKWVKNNIRSFGGDPKKVTVFGESAGGASVHALCLAKQAKNLFQKAIIQSGVLTNPWANVESNKKVGFSLAEIMGKNFSESTEVIEFFRTIPAKKLVETFEKTQCVNDLLSSLVLVPSMDSCSPNPLFPKCLKTYESNGIDVPVIIGYNSHEGIMSFAGKPKNFVEQHNEILETIVQQVLKIEDPEKASELSKKIREFYFGKNNIDSSKLNELVQFYGDLFFVANILNVAEIQMDKPSPTYLYKYSYRANVPMLKSKLGLDHIEGTCHSDDLYCLFCRETVEKLKEGSRDRKCMQRLTKMWTDFAKTGNPTPNTDDELITTIWKSIDRSAKHYLEINDNLVPGVDPDKDKWKLWKSVLRDL